MLTYILCILTNLCAQLSKFKTTLNMCADDELLFTLHALI